MITTVSEALDYIESQRINATSLDDFKDLFAKYNNFQKDLKCIHITGTNGKGSTSKLLHDSLKNDKYKVGLFTSPHMIVANDRIRINGINISDDEIIHYVNLFRDDIEAFKLNFFQIYTLIALRYFYDKACDFVILEVGIGGLYDSTNVVDAMISIITNISFDHTDKLGSSVLEIAKQKAGIMKASSLTITAVRDEVALDYIKERSKELHTSLIVTNAVLSEGHGKMLHFMYKGKNYRLNSLAKYQVENALIVLEAHRVLRDVYDYALSEEALDLALASFQWTGRFELVSENPDIIIDGAHNISGMNALLESDDQNSLFIFSALKDKDYPQMIEMIQNHAEEMVFCEFDFYRALKIDDLEAYSFKKYRSVEECLQYLTERYPQRRIIICGSLYFISDVRKIIQSL